MASTNQDTPVSVVPSAIADPAAPSAISDPAVPALNLDPTFFESEDVDDVAFAAQFAQLAMENTDAVPPTAVPEAVRAKLMKMYDIPDNFLEGTEGSNSGTTAEQTADLQEDLWDSVDAVLKAQGLELMSDDEECMAINEAAKADAGKCPFANLQPVLQAGREAFSTPGSPMAVMTPCNSLSSVAANVGSNTASAIANSTTAGSATSSSSTKTILPAGKLHSLGVNNTGSANNTGAVTDKNSLLVVKGIKEGRALDLQSMLCLQDGTPLGVVVDTFGNIHSPHYLVFSLLTDVADRLAEGDDVFYIKEKSNFAMDFLPTDYELHRTGIESGSDCEGGSSDEE